MHPLIACLCNSRIAQPAHAGQGPAWPVFVLWGGLLVAVVAGAVVWRVRHRRPPASRPDEHGRPSTFVGRPDAVIDDEQDQRGQAPARESGPPTDRLVTTAADCGDHPVKAR